MRTLGIDPGLASCGWAIIDHDGHRYSIAGHGTLRTGTDLPLALRVQSVADGIEDVLLAHAGTEAPAGVGIEAWTYQGARSQSWASSTVPRVIQAVRMVAERYAEDVEEVDTRSAKRALGLRGRTSKRQVQAAVQAMTGEKLPSHAADAAAVAVWMAQRLRCGHGR